MIAEIENIEDRETVGKSKNMLIRKADGLVVRNVRNAVSSAPKMTCVAGLESSGTRCKACMRVRSKRRYKADGEKMARVATLEAQYETVVKDGHTYLVKKEPWAEQVLQAPVAE